MRERVPRLKGGARAEKEISEKVHKIIRFQIVSTHFLHGAFKVLFSFFFVNHVSQTTKTSGYNCSSFKNGYAAKRKCKELHLILRRKKFSGNFF